MIAGGGLAGALIALRLAQTRPGISIALIEQGSALGGEHTWSFHETDLSPSARGWIAPLVAHRWPRQYVRFPDHQRTIETPYASITSARLHQVVAATLGDQITLSAAVSSVSATEIVLADGRVIDARAVIDARGDRQSRHIALGFQKFVGQEIEFAAPHGLDGPVIMDATVPQEDGYRFLYVLPFTERTALVEDTRYADGAALDRESLRRGVADYCRRQGWTIVRILREEEGVLPIALAGDIDAHLDEGGTDAARVGLSAALFHPVTGYSLPDAVTTADLIASLDDLSGASIAAAVRAHAAQRWADRGFYRLLNRMLFGAAEPDQRYKVLQRFYKLSQPLIERFYAGQTPLQDRARILFGKPPVPILRAVECVDEAAWLRRAAKG